MMAKRPTTRKASLLADPWTSWPGESPYDVLAAAGVSVDSPQSAIRDAFFGLMEQGPVSDPASAAYNQLRIVSRRLLVDAMYLDAAIAPELLAMLDDPPKGDEPEPPLSQRIPFSWDV